MIYSPLLKEFVSNEIYWQLKKIKINLDDIGFVRTYHVLKYGKFNNYSDILLFDPFNFINHNYCYRRLICTYFIIDLSRTVKNKINENIRL